MKKLFISDLHLDESRPDLLDAFTRFLEEKAKNADELYILGDFFEVWLGDDHDTKFNQKIIDSLANLEIPIFIMHGNRDFLLGPAFCQKIGATLLPDPSTIDIGDKQVLLMHGDSLCTSDEQYMQVRKMLRDENFQKDFLTKSLDERQAFADSARNQSREHTRETASDIMDVTPAEVEKQMANFNVTTMIHGHTHRPCVHDIRVSNEASKRYVLGDWDKLGWYLEASNGKLDLISFEINPG